MKHIRYLKTAIPICEKPEVLGLDLVVADGCNQFELPCTYCSALLMEWNKASYEAELIGLHNGKQTKQGDNVSARYLWLAAIGFTTAFWLGFFGILWWLLYA